MYFRTITFPLYTYRRKPDDFWLSFELILITNNKLLVLSTNQNIPTFINKFTSVRIHRFSVERSSTDKKQKSFSVEIDEKSYRLDYNNNILQDEKYKKLV